MLKYRRSRMQNRENEENEENETQKKNPPFSIEWGDLKKQEKEKDERRKDEEFQDQKQQSTQKIMKAFGIRGDKSHFEFQEEATNDGSALLRKLKDKFSQLDLQKNQVPPWRKLMAPDDLAEKPREGAKINKLDYMQHGYLIIKIERKDEEEFKKSKFWIQLR